MRFDLNAGDLISLHEGPAEQTASLLVFDQGGDISPEIIGLRQNASLSTDRFDAGALLGWIASHGGQERAEFPVTELRVQDLCVFRATAACTVWVIRPLHIYELVAGGDAGQLTVSCTPASQNSAILPPPLGDVRDEFTVTRGTARAYEVEPGEIVQVIDIDGQQCSDFMAMRADALETGLERFIDSTATRSMVRGAYPGPGLLDKFFDQDLNPLMNVLQDTCGRHDAFGMACTARGYEERGFPGHVNCSDNISEALVPFGVSRRPAWPAINFFWNTWVDHHSHELLTEESHSRPGDYVAMKAMDALVCVSWE
ncbi:MAG: urea carboxylase-associated family protein [Pseudomonadota bacterium]